MNRPIYGNPATTPNPVADFNQNNPNKADYIKNRPIYKGNGENSLRTEDATALSDDSMAIGNNSVAGVKGYYCNKSIDGVLFEEDGKPKTKYRLYLHRTQEETNGELKGDDNIACEYQVGDVVSVGDNKKIYLNCAKIVNLGGYFIDVDVPLPFEVFTDTTDLDDTDRLVFVLSKPDIGIATAGNFAMSFGDGNKALGFCAFSSGRGNIALGAYANSEGRATIAYYAAHSEGLKTIAFAYAHSEGMYTEATGEAAHSEGNKTKASAACAHSEGNETEASGMCAHAQNFQTKATGGCSNAQGGRTVASAEAANAQGWESEASGAYSDACGLKTKAKGKASHTGGIENITEGEAAFAEGYKNTVKGDRAFAAGGQWCSVPKEAPDAVVHGIGCSATAPAQRVGGRFAKGNPNCAEIVGNGTDSNHRSNAYELYWNGDVRYAGFVECKGIILTSPNGTRYKITLSDARSFNVDAVDTK